MFGYGGQFFGGQRLGGYSFWLSKLMPGYSSLLGILDDSTVCIYANMSSQDVWLIYEAMLD